MPSLSIVIPYFQREAGVLRRALDSVLEQSFTDWHLIIVDDASPVPARTELAALASLLPEQRCTLIEQANSGPAGARNRGLNAVSADSEYVAFLDSDDTWSPGHLQRAHTGLEQGYDLYFADHLQLGADTAAFSRAGRLCIDEHPLLAGAEADIHIYRGDLFQQTLTGNVIGTSTVVYRHSRFPQQRFHDELVFAGEDYLFWMELACAGAQALFSTHTEAIYGRGVNVFAGSVWGTEHSLDRLCDEIDFCKTLPTLFALDTPQQAFVDSRLHTLRRALALDVVHRLSHRKPLKLPRLRRLWRSDPLALALILPNFLSARLQRPS